MLFGKWTTVKNGLVKEVGTNKYNVIYIHQKQKIVVAWEVLLSKYTDIQLQKSLEYSKGCYYIREDGRLYDGEKKEVLEYELSKAIIAESLVRYEEQKVVYEQEYLNNEKLQTILKVLNINNILALGL